MSGSEGFTVPWEVTGAGNCSALRLSFLEQYVHSEVPSCPSRKSLKPYYRPIRIIYLLICIEPAERCCRIVVRFFPRFFQRTQRIGKAPDCCWK